MPGSSGAVLVTGATGFVGSAVAARLAAGGWQVRAPARRPPASSAAGVQWLPGGDLGQGWDAADALAGAHAVVHCAARVHVMREQATDPLAAFREVNVHGTLRLARQAVRAGVRRFVFVSSIGVNGSSTADRPFRADDPPAPHSPYAVSKAEAEAALLALGAAEGLEVVVLRPPLVHGPGAPGNLARLLGLLRRGLPLPLARVRNRRSLVGLDNLADLVARALEHPAAAGQVFLAADGEDVSTPELLRGLARGMGRPARLWPFPPTMLQAMARAAGRGEMAVQLCGSLQLDIDKTRRLLQWTPPVPLAEGLRRAGGGAVAA